MYSESRDRSNSYTGRDPVLRETLTNYYTDQWPSYHIMFSWRFMDAIENENKKETWYYTDVDRVQEVDEMDTESISLWASKVW